MNQKYIDVLRSASFLRRAFIELTLRGFHLVIKSDASAKTDWILET